MKISNKKLLHALGKNDDTDDDLATSVSNVASDTAISGVQWVTGPDPSAPPTAIVHRITPEPIPVTTKSPRAPRPILESVEHPQDTEVTQDDVAIDSSQDQRTPVPAPRETPPPLSPPPESAPSEPTPVKMSAQPPTHSTDTEETPREDVDTAQRVRNMFKRLSESKRTYQDREQPPALKEEPVRKAWMPAPDPSPKVAPQEPPDIWESISPSTGVSASPVPLNPLPPPQADPSLDTMLVDELLGDESTSTPTKKEGESATEDVPDMWNAIGSNTVEESRVPPSLGAEEIRKDIPMSEPSLNSITFNASETNTVEKAPKPEQPMVPTIKMEPKKNVPTHDTPTPPPDPRFKEAIRTDAHTKANAVRELFEGKTIPEVAQKYGVTTVHVLLWKRIAEEELHKVFKTNTTQESTDGRTEIDALKHKIDSLHTLLGERDDEIASLKENEENGDKYT